MPAGLRCSLPLQQVRLNQMVGHKLRSRLGRAIGACGNGEIGTISTRLRKHARPGPTPGTIWTQAPSIKANFLLARSGLS